MSTTKTHIETEKQLIPSLRFNGFQGEWVLKYVTELIKGHKGAMKIGPFGSQLKKDTFVDDGFKVYGQENIFIEDFEFGDRYITDDHFNRLKTNEIHPNDFVVSTMGTIGRCTVIPEGIKRGIMDSHMIRLQLNNEVITPEFISQLFGSFKMLKQVKRLSVGGIMDGLSIGIMKELKFQIPEVPEQQKIASFLSSVDEKIQQLTAKKNLLEQYKKGVMQQLFSGQLRFKDENGNDFPDWEEKRLIEINDLIHGDGDWILSENIGHNQKYSIIQLGNIGLGEFIDKKLKTLSEENFKAVKGTLISKGDILINRMVDNDLNVCLFPYSGDYITSVDVCWIRSGEEIYNSFISFLIQTRENQKKLLSLSSGSGRVRISKKNLFERFKFQLPILEEQQKIATYLSSLDTKIETVNKRITQTQTFKKGLLQQMFV